VEIRGEASVLWDVMRRTAGAGVNTDLLCVACDGRLVLGVDDLDKARTIFLRRAYVVRPSRCQGGDHHHVVRHASTLDV